MAFFFLCVFVFVMFFQPVSVFPVLAPLQPYQHSALLALGAFIFFEKKSPVPLFSISNTRYFFLFALWQVFSSATIWLHGALNTFMGIWLNLIIIYVIIVKSCVNERRIKTVMLMVIAGIFYLSFKSVSDLLLNYRPNLRPMGYGWYENPNDLVLILSCVIPFALCFGELAKSIIKRYFFISIAALFAVNILLSASRNGLLGLFTVGSLSVLFMKKMSRFMRYIIFSVLLISILTFGIATVLTRSHLDGRLIGDTSSEHRIVQWKACLRMVKAHPIFGVGPKESRYQIRDYGGIGGLPPHNTLVQVFAETGLPGGIFYFIFVFCPLYEAWQFFKVHKDKLDLPSVIIYKYLIISLIGFLTCALFSNRVYFKILYLTIALIVAMRNNILKDQVEERVKS